MAELDPLPDDIQALLKRAQGGTPAPPPGAEAAVLAKVSATVGVPVAGAASSLAWIKPLAALSVAALVTVGVVDALRSEEAPRTLQGPVALMRPVDVVAPIDAVAAPAVVEAPNVEAPNTESPRVEAPNVDAPNTERPRVEAPTVDTPRPAVAATPSRAVEGALLEAARDALARGDADAAMAKLEEHQKEFGARGQLVEERHALTVVAFSQRGDAARAQSAAKAFFRLYPNSLFSDTVRAAAGAP